MNIWDIVVILLVGAMIRGAVWALKKNDCCGRKKCSGCCESCSGCHTKPQEKS